MSFDYRNLGLPAPDKQVSFEESLGADGVDGDYEFVEGVSGMAVRGGEGGMTAAYNVTSAARRGYPLSVSLWLAVPEGAELGGDQYIFQWGHAPGVVVWLDGEGFLRWEVVVSNGKRAQARVTTAPVARGVWHHLVLVVQQVNLFGGAKVTSYLNGQYAAETSYDGGLLNITNIDRPGWFGVGRVDESVLVDEVAVWKRVLTAGNVAAVFAAGNREVLGVGGAPVSGWGVVW